MAVFFNHLVCAKILIDSGLDVNHALHIDGWCYLRVAALHGHKEMTELLLIKGGSILYGLNYLHIAACFGYEEMVDLLLKNGANVNAKTRRGKTPFCLAIDRGYNNCARKLVLECGADTGICCTRHKQMTSIWVLCSVGKTKRRIPRDLLKMVGSMLEL